VGKQKQSISLAQTRCRLSQNNAIQRILVPHLWQTEIWCSICDRQKSGTAFVTDRSLVPHLWQTCS